MKIGIGKALRKVKPDLCFENLSWHLKIWKQNFRQEKMVTIFHVVLLQNNYRRKAPNWYQKFDFVEKQSFYNFYYHKLETFYNCDPFFFFRLTYFYDPY